MSHLTFLALPNSIPSHGTFPPRVFMLIDLDALEVCFT